MKIWRTATECRTTRVQQILRTTVAIVGDGVVSAFAARKLTALGVDHVIIPGPMPGGEQTQACQGLLHRGYFYLDGNPQLLSSLNEAALEWRRVVTETGLETVKDKVFVGIDTDAQAEQCTARWSQFSLPFEGVADAARPALLRSPKLQHLFRTSETWIKNLLDLRRKVAGSSHRLPGTVVRYERTGDQIQAIVLQPNGVTQLVVADDVILAAGGGTGQLLADAGDLTEDVAPQRRRCQVVTLHGMLPDLALLCPTIGHFIVPYHPGNDPASGKAAWRCTFEADLPLADAEVATLDVNRLHSHLTSLKETLPGLWPLVATVSVTPAVKSESAVLGCGNRPNGYFAGRAASGAVIVYPTKLTLAPLAAQAAVNLLKSAAYGARAIS